MKPEHIEQIKALVEAVEPNFLGWGKSPHQVHKAVIKHLPALKAVIAGWQPIESCPDSDEIVVFLEANGVPTFGRADDYHNSASYLEGARYWFDSQIPPPPKESA